MIYVKPIFVSIILLVTLSTSAQQTIQLYKDSIPNSKNAPDEEDSTINGENVLIISKVSRPTLTIYHPEKGKANGASVIICPGGGYGILAAGHEGADVARRFTEMGVTAFVLKYRIPDDRTMINREIGPLQDAQRAIQLVRENARKWKLDKNRVGILGFSAGGHLASTASTQFQQAVIDNRKSVNLRPDFSILVYPVISFSDSIGHQGSREQLIGKTATREKVMQYSNELRVTPSTPPAFLVHAKDDPVKVENTIAYAEALRKNKVDVETYLYESGGHGYGMYNKSSDVLWMNLVEAWMKKMRFIK